MQEKIDKMNTEIDYKAEVVKRFPKATLEVMQVGYGTGHSEYRVKVDEAGGRPVYLSNIAAFEEDKAWQYAYEGMQKV